MSGKLKRKVAEEKSTSEEKQVEKKPEESEEDEDYESDEVKIDLNIYHVLLFTFFYLIGNFVVYVQTGSFSRN